MNESDPNLVDHTVLSTSDFADGEIAYRRRQARGALSVRERVLVIGSAAVVVFVAVNLLWAWLT